MNDTTVAVGVFDGVHRGHQALLAHARGIAQQRGGELVAVSFDPHPVALLRPSAFEGLLTLPERRAELLRTAGADRVEWLTFDERMRNLSPEDFVRQVLIGDLHANAVVVGGNFTFGRAAAGDINTLRQLGDEHGVEIHTAELAGDGVTWSSTRVRAAATAGDVGLAAAILGRPHRVSGIVVHGDHRGRELGFPTANIEVAAPLIVPADGVYSAVAWLPSGPHPAAVSIGNNPTFGDVAVRRVEVHVIDQADLDLYGATLTVDFVHRVRGMEAFGGVDQLLAAMNRDVEQAREHVLRFRA